VRVVVASADGLVVEVGCPWAGAPGVGGKVAKCVAELFIRGPAEGDGHRFPQCLGGEGDAAEAGQRLRCGKSAAGVADLGE
jgi:hypothetical protein